MTSLVGGGVGLPRPGAISMAHNGVLFLDETPEFQSSALESLRQPLESGRVAISRSKGSAEFPARFQLVLSANPCPCGRDGTSNCSCTAQQLIRYRSKLSGPLLDRVDIQLRIQSAKTQMLRGVGVGQSSSSQIRQKVVEARGASLERLRNTPWKTNARVLGSWLRTGPGRLPPKLIGALDRALERGVISMRGYDRCLRLTWTLADLEGRTAPSADDLALAMYLRGVDAFG
jgi:magnesium chelatase family protein